jgi:hypothetical protein
LESAPSPITLFLTQTKLLPAKESEETERYGKRESHFAEWIWKVKPIITTNKKYGLPY